MLAEALSIARDKITIIIAEEVIDERCVANLII